MRRGLRSVRRRRGMRRLRRATVPRYRRVGSRLVSFTETFIPSPAFVSNGALVFTGQIGGLPQYAQYAALYNQYRINWVQVMLVPQFNSNAEDGNSFIYNNSVGLGGFGMSRIAWAVQDTPSLNPASAVPASEQAVMTCNGAKVRSIGSKWSCKFRPVIGTDVNAGTAVAGTILARSKSRPFLNFTGNPLTEAIHYGVQAYISTYTTGGATPSFYIYYKINFTLRDPK